MLTQRGDETTIVVATQRDQQPGTRLGGGRDPAEQMGRRVVGPLHVLSDEDERLVVDRGDQFQHDVGGPVGTELRSDRVGFHR